MIAKPPSFSPASLASASVTVTFATVNTPALPGGEQWQVIYNADSVELLVGSVAGRNSPHEITLFKSLGLAVEDLAAAHLVYRRALEQDAGVDIEIGGLRE